MRYMWLGIIFVLAYLIGSISTAIILSKAHGTDIRTKGSGNAGATNALRTMGKKAGIIVTLGDCLKAVIAICLGLIIANFTIENGHSAAVYIAGIGAVLGHNFPIYYGFKGGKGVLVSMVAILFADWKIGLIVIAVALVIMAVTRYVSLGSVIGAVSLFLLALVMRSADTAYIIFAFVLAALAVFMHRGNIKRLIKGEENKLGGKKSG